GSRRSVGADGGNEEKDSVGERASGNSRPQGITSCVVPRSTEGGYRRAPTELRRDGATHDYLFDGVIRLQMPESNSAQATGQHKGLKRQITVGTKLNVL